MRMCNYCGKVEFPFFAFGKVYLCFDCKRNGVTKKQAEKQFHLMLVKQFGKKKTEKLERGGEQK